jgi:hypothetical protein
MHHFTLTVHVSLAKLGFCKLYLGHIRLGHDNSRKIIAFCLDTGKVALTKIVQLITGCVSLTHVTTDKDATIYVLSVDRRESKVLGLSCVYNTVERKETRVKTGVSSDAVRLRNSAE